MDFKADINEIFPKVIEFRRYLHRHPELSEHEENTRKFICSVLKDYEIPFRTGEKDHSVVAIVGQNKGKCIGIRADIDALPVKEDSGLPWASENEGVMHACGHDIHTAILLGTGIILKKYEDMLPGTVKLFFQPAEETIGGAATMIEEGCLKNPDVDSIIALHVDPSNECGKIVLKYGPMNAATMDFVLHVYGKSCHGAHPECGIDPIVMASQIILSLQTISSRFNAPTTPVILTIGKIEGGTSGNIIPECVHLTGTLRSLTTEGIFQSRTLMTQIAENTAAAFGGHVQFDWGDDMYPPLINDKSVTGILEETVKEVFGADHLVLMEEPSLGADDFSFFTEAVKGSYFNLGTAIPGKPFYPLHNSKFIPEEESMKYGMEMFLNSVINLFK